MSDETTLLPCPFCGGEAKICHVRDICHSPEDAYWARCKNFTCRMSGRHFYTEAEAIAAWNARAERTCEAVRDERTQTIVCSKCRGGGLTIPNKGQKTLRNYCPNCGCKVVNE